MFSDSNLVDFFRASLKSCTHSSSLADLRVLFFLLRRGRTKFCCCCCRTMTRKRTKNHHPVPERQKLDADWLPLPSPSCPTTLRSITFARHNFTREKFTSSLENPKFSQLLALFCKLSHFSPIFTTLCSNLPKIFSSACQTIHQSEASFYFSQSPAHTHILLHLGHSLALAFRFTNTPPTMSRVTVFLKTIFIRKINHANRMIFSHCFSGHGKKIVLNNLK